LRRGFYPLLPRARPPPPKVGPERGGRGMPAPARRRDRGAMIEARALTKRYGSALAVDSVSFTAKPYRVTGFLGPNGAGKSTTMRMLVGLARPDSGAARILGAPFVDVPNPGRHVGVLLDASASHAGRTGRETLALAALTMGLGPGAVDRALDRVGLSRKEAARRTGGYSLGMRQRLRTPS